MQKFIFILCCIFTTSAYSQRSCKFVLPLDSIEVNLWIIDSLGNNNSRNAIYLRHFFQTPGDREKYNGICQNCILEVLGSPNRVFKRKKEEKYIYFIKRESKEIDSFYEGRTLEIIFKNQKVINFSFFIT